MYKLYKLLYTMQVTCISPASYTQARAAFKYAIILGL